MRNNRLEIGNSAYKELVSLLPNNSGFVTYDGSGTWIFRNEKTKSDVGFIEEIGDCDLPKLSMLVIQLHHVA